MGRSLVSEYADSGVESAELELDESDTDLTDIDDTNHIGKQDESADETAWLLDDGNYPREYYLQQLESFHKEEYVKEDYGDGTTRLLDRMEQQWNHSLGTYWKVFRLVYERATGEKIEGKTNRSMHKVLRKLVKKYKLSKIGRDKTCMYVEDQTLVLQTNLLHLYLQLGGFTANRPQSILGLCYQHIQVTLFRDLEGGPHQILIEFTFEFTKQFLGIKDMNTFPLPEIIYDESLAFSPQVFLLRMLFYDRAFAAYNLTTLEELSRLYIPPKRNELPLRLNRDLDDIPVFRKAIRTPSGWEISKHEPLPYSTLLPAIKALGQLTNFKQVTRPYSLCYAGGKAFNENGNVSEAMQNLMMGHASINAIMRAACTMSRSIDSRRPQRLTLEESTSVNDLPELKRNLPNATRHPEYKELNYEINRERQRQRFTLFQKKKERWEYEQPVRDVEQQLDGIETKDEVEALESLPMPPVQQELVDAVLAQPGTTLEEEIRRRNRTIRAVMQYCGVEEGGTHPSRAMRTRTYSAPHTKCKDDLRSRDEMALEAAKVSVYKDHRPTICFMCLANGELPIADRIYSFRTSGDLTKHFKRKHLANLREGEATRCGLCEVDLDHKMHLQRHSFQVHGTVT
ncbi:hypothetical protein CC78DRAFT_554127 [Lojkania enalia]|uniref:C2H2-type domain-containing protein n=1 Tax=Lojkania enalia TaxID=147567 RepID=A0A9P4K5H5_9PLEO|nr:hypothetical protein CC78DRAFT_554127 [Didymosphaeria enalia]